MSALLHGSLMLVAVGSLVGLFFLMFEGSINGPRRRDYIAGKAIGLLYGTALFLGFAYVLGSNR